MLGRQTLLTRTVLCEGREAVVPYVKILVHAKIIHSPTLCVALLVTLCDVKPTSINQWSSSSKAEKGSGVNCEDRSAAIKFWKQLKALSKKRDPKEQVLNRQLEMPLVGKAKINNTKNNK